MYVCLCNAVTDHQIRAEIRRGACTMRELRDRLGIANRCGRCGPCARALLLQHAIDRPQQEITTNTGATVIAQA
jgi:bacterioferritin-associated ferredoxin